MLLLCFFCLKVTLSDFVTWNTTVGGPSGRKSGTVCGQDPRFVRAVTGSVDFRQVVAFLYLCIKKRDTLHSCCLTHRNRCDLT